MSRRDALLVLSVSVTIAAAAPVRHAGEWEVTVNGGEPRLVCFSKDDTFDKNTLTRAMAKIPGSSCTMTTLETVGNVTTFASQCTIQGATIESSGTITETGTDAFTSKIHSHGGAMQLPNGQSFTMPDVDITNVSHRLGPCKPGDHVIEH